MWVKTYTFVIAIIERIPQLRKGAIHQNNLNKESLPVGRAVSLYRDTEEIGFSP